MHSMKFQVIRQNPYLPIVTCVLLMSLVVPVLAQQPDDLTSKSMEDLMNMQVTSVSQKSEKLSRVSAAIFVITPEDIRNSGATNIPDLLRMVPGLNVAQIDASTWAISARGLNGRFSNKLLVLVDGRSVYTPTTGGVFWDVVDMPFEDIERIEVIRGPGGSVWGANAVNGVINIISKDASETVGATVVAGGGTTEPASATVQYGGKFGGSTDYRAFARYFDFDRLPNPPGQRAADDWHLLRGGFRADDSFSGNDSLSLEGDVYTGREGLQTRYGPSQFAPGIVNAYNVMLGGGFFQTEWKHTSTGRGETSLRVSYDAYERNDTLREGRGTFDAGFRHHFLTGSRHDWVWGVEDRYSSSKSGGDFFVSLIPSDIKTNLFGVFLQDEIAVVPERLYFTLGTKVEHNYYTGWNIMPSVRVAWIPNLHQTLWAAVSRTTRTPDDGSASIRVNFATITTPFGPPTLLSLLGNRNFGDESLNSYEIGYRRAVSSRASVDAALYYDNFDDLETHEPSAPFLEPSPAPAHIVVPLIFRNLMYGETHGLELAANWKLSGRWTVSPGYSFEGIHMHVRQSSQDTLSVAEAQGSSPVHSAQLRSQLALSHNLNWNVSAYFSDRLSDPAEASYTRLDTGFSWKFAERNSIAIFGQNLLRDHHTEFVDSRGSVQTTFVKRSVYAQFTMKF